VKCFLILYFNINIFYFKYKTHLQAAVPVVILVLQLLDLCAELELGGVGLLDLFGEACVLVLQLVDQDGLLLLRLPDGRVLGLQLVLQLSEIGLQLEDPLIALVLGDRQFLAQHMLLLLEFLQRGK